MYVHVCRSSRKFRIKEVTNVNFDILSSQQFSSDMMEMHLKCFVWSLKRMFSLFRLNGDPKTSRECKVRSQRGLDCRLKIVNKISIN